MNNANAKPLSAVMAELKDEIKEFLQTRYQMLVAELKDKLRSWKTAIPLFAVALVFIGVGFLLLTGALVAAIAVAIGVGWSLLVVGLLYCMIGAICALFGYREVENAGVAPSRTLRVLRQDRIWLQNEARSQ